MMARWDERKNGCEIIWDIDAWCYAHHTQAKATARSQTTVKETHISPSSVCDVVRSPTREKKKSLFRLLDNSAWHLGRFFFFG